MDKFPQESIDHMCGYLSPDDLATAYYVSTKFCKAAEVHADSFRTQSIDLSKGNTKKLVDYYSGFRLRYLKNVPFTHSIPDRKLAGYHGCRETADERHANDKTFTLQCKNFSGPSS
jgi:hypothetical protein